MALPRRLAPVGMGAAVGIPWEDNQFKEDYPALHSFLFDTRYSDGTSRLQGSISFFVQGYSLKVAINDKDRGCVAFLNAGTFLELLTMIDDGIRDDKLEWKGGSKPQPEKIPPF